MQLRRSKWDILQTILSCAAGDMGPETAWHKCEEEEDGVAEDVVEDTYERLVEVASKIEAARES